MKFIDILILITCIAGLIFFFIHHIKYSSKSMYIQKTRRLRELKLEIYNIKLQNDKTDEIIINMKFDTDLSEIPADELIKYSDNNNRLETLKKEQIKIEKYLIKAHPYMPLYF